MKQPNRIWQSFRAAVHFWVLGMFLGLGVAQISAQEMTAREKKNVEQVKTLITKAGLEFKEKKFGSSAKMIASVERKLARFAKSADGEYLEQLVRQHQRMAKAHQMLVDKGQKLKELEPFRQGNTSGPGARESSAGVSFVSTVAPILNAKCGRCHVARSRGRFSARDYRALMNSTTVTPGQPDVSYLVEVIEDGSMPKGGLTVTETELVSLKKWIAEGAKFDGADATKSIAELRDAAGQGGNGRPSMMETKKPAGTETVSFAAHVAPVLLQHCGRCHMARNPRGNFNMSRFATFIRGGDSGAPVQSGNSAASNLIKRLRGEGGDVMPPAGKLDDALVNNIAKWIDEGARFDPDDANLTMQALAAKGKSESLDHDQLIEFRQSEAGRIWKLVMSDIEPERMQSENFQLLSTPTEEGLDRIAKLADSLAGQISKQLGTESRERFVRGKGTIFIVTRRYDFGEFGKMLLRREFPRQLEAWWDHNGTIAYSAMLKSKDKSVDDIRVLMTRQLAAMHVADLAPGIPRWFADGLGFQVAAKMYRKDPVVEAWSVDAVAAAGSMNRIDDFLMNRMDEDKSGLVSFLFVGKLQSQRGRFKKLMSRLLAGEEFDSVFVETYGKTPDKLFEN